MDLKFQKLNLAQLKTLVGWAKEEGWDPGPHDADVFWQTDPNGFYGYFHEGKLIAGGAIVSYRGAFGFMGLFIVHKSYRSKGIGRSLWHQRRDTLIDRLNPGATIGMDGVLEMQPFYKKGGFEIAYRDERYEKVGLNYMVSDKVVGFNEKDFDRVNKYDTECFGFPRSEFLKPWLHMEGTKKFMYSDHGSIQGYAVLRKTGKGHKIGPLFADKPTIGEELYKACLNAATGESVYIDIPMINQGAVEMVKKHNANYVFECARMYHGQAPNHHVNKVFGITTLELG